MRSICFGFTTDTRCQNTDNKQSREGEAKFHNGPPELSLTIFAHSIAMRRTKQYPGESPRPSTLMSLGQKLEAYEGAVIRFPGFTAEYSRVSWVGWCRAYSLTAKARESVWVASATARLLRR